MTTRPAIVRIRTVTAGCLQLGSGTVVFATRAITFDSGDGSKTSVPGFNGTVRSIAQHLNRGVLRVVEPAADSTTRYLVMWSGGEGPSIDEIVSDLFVPRPSSS